MCGRINLNCPCPLYSISVIYHGCLFSALRTYNIYLFILPTKLHISLFFCCLLLCLCHRNSCPWVPLPFARIKRCLDMLFKAFIDVHIFYVISLALCRWLWCYKHCVSRPFSTETRLQVGILLTSTLACKIVCYCGISHLFLTFSLFHLVIQHFKHFLFHSIASKSFVLLFYLTFNSSGKSRWH